MVLTKREVRALYDRIAPLYDLALRGYQLAGIDGHRRQAVELLCLHPGDTVVDLGCGTGANFRFPEEAVGPDGRIIGVDISGAMLEIARERCTAADWRNVELVEGDFSEFQFPPETRGTLATFAVEMVPDYDDLIRRIAHGPGRRLALLGLKHPDRWPSWLVTLGTWINKPFGVSREYAAFRPWESLRAHLKEVEYREFYFGAVYLAVGERTPSRDRRGASGTHHVSVQSGP